VCFTRALVAPVVDGVIEEIGIGFCFVCSYRRTQDVAEAQRGRLTLAAGLRVVAERVVWADPLIAWA
jgi:hypothetical protein